MNTETLSGNQVKVQTYFDLYECREVLMASYTNPKTGETKVSRMETPEDYSDNPNYWNTILKTVVIHAEP